MNLCYNINEEGNSVSSPMTLVEVVSNLLSKPKGVGCQTTKVPFYYLPVTSVTLGVIVSGPDELHVT